MIDYEITNLGGDFQVWTPDGTGGCIGSGRTANEARKDAVKNLLLLADELEGSPGKREL